MADYAQVKTLENLSIGAVLGVQTAGSPPADGQLITYVEILAQDPAPSVGVGSLGWFYDSATDTFLTAVKRSVLSAYLTPSSSVFWFGYFDSTERAKVWAACNGVDLPGVSITDQIRYRLAAWRDVTLSGNVNLQDAETIAVVNGMESAGIIGSGRAAEILDT